MSTSAVPDPDVAALRSFNRFYTRQIGVLQQGLLDSPFTLTEARVLYELANRQDATAAEIGAELGLDAGYLSRILRRFETAKLLRREPSRTDARRSHLRLTRTGSQQAATLAQRSNEQAAALLSGLSPERRRKLLAGAQAIREALEPQSPAPIILREPHPGDYGWVIERHGALYAQEYGWDLGFDIMVAGIIAGFANHWNPARERCWIAERAGERVGCIFLVAHPKKRSVAKLRMLLVEPAARGTGLGTTLVNECLRFARAAGYRKVMLWTNSILIAARAIYEKAGFRLIDEEPHTSFGKELIGQTWELEL
jgi:DNA-binding MarR family transcriptional regulator/N-acetylglutamate synthase-like GNAT family acetyltransferase